MATLVIMPRQGQSVESCVITAFNKKVGDTVKKGDVLFNRTNSRELVGKTCAFMLDAPMIIAGYIIRLRMNGKVCPEYLSTFLNLDSSKKMLMALSKGAVGQANINAKEVQAVRKSGLTFAPEAGSQRLRDVINKNVREEDLIESCKIAFEGGWKERC